MNKNVKKIIKYSMITILTTCILLITIFTVFFAISYDVKFNEEKITTSNLKIDLYDDQNVSIRESNKFNGSNVKLNALPDYIKNSFISIEDKNFYKHNGLNYKRIVKAFITNIKAMEIKEGASTISQQLIKNTHLSNEKTFKRKFNEIIITKKLEKEFSKDEILECYLNVIYFGNNCYGIENASEYYYSKKAKDLTIDESATLAGIIKSPNYFCPIKNTERCKNRRNIVLREMYKDKKLSFEELNTYTQKDIVLNINSVKNDRINTYSEIALSEAMKILKSPAKQIAISGYKIYTYKNDDLQEQLSSAIKKLNPKTDYSAVSINKNGHIEAYVASSAYKIIDNPRQPGSAIKPVLVYAPAIEENIISPSTEILDEPIEIDGYEPRNLGNKYNGYISCKDALSKSLNVPTIKILSYLGIEKAKAYATKCGINFSNYDTGYSIGLGGMTNGTNVLELTGSYLPFINEGNMIQPTTIKYITDKNGKIVYKNESKLKNVYRDDTAYLVTDMLKQAAQSGTSKVLNDLNFDIASKSGTVGINNKNYDAWNICYTSDNVTGVWLGNMDNSPIEYVGGGMPAKICKEYYKCKYKNNTPSKFNRPSSVIDIDIDLIELRENHRVIKANDYTPERYRQTETFSRFNEPKELSTNFITLDATIIKGNISNSYANITINTKDYLIYELYKIKDNKTELCQVISNKNGETVLREKIEKNKIVSYFVICKIKNFTNNTEIISEKSNIIELMSTSENSMINNNNSSKSKWYI